MQDYVSLRELVLVEEFKNCIPEQTAIYLKKTRGYICSTRSSFSGQVCSIVKSAFDSISLKENSVCTCDTNDQNPSGFKFCKECSYCHKTGHIITVSGFKAKAFGFVTDSSPRLFISHISTHQY